MYYLVKIIQQQAVKFPLNHATILLAEPEASYQIVDEQGNVVQPVKIEMESGDLLIWTEQTTEPTVILQGYTNYYAPSAHFTEQVNLLHTGVEASQMSVGKVLGWTAAIVGGAGLVAAAAGGKSGGGSGHHSEPPSSQNVEDPTTSSGSENTATTNSDSNVVLPEKNTSPNTGSSVNNEMVPKEKEHLDHNELPQNTSENRDEQILAPKIALNTEKVQLHLAKISLEPAASDLLVVISGQLVDLPEIFNQGRNKQRINGLNIIIGEQSFYTIIDKETQTLQLVLTKEIAQTLVGKPMSYQFDLPNTLPILTTSKYYDYKLDNVDTPKLNSDNIELMGNYISGEKGQYVLQLPDENKVTIQGNILGGKAGDKINLWVGDHAFSTEVKNDLTFSYEIEKSKIVNQPIKAELTSIINGKEYKATDHLFVAIEPELDAKFVSEHKELPPENLPYFIRSLMAQDRFFHTESAPFDPTKTAKLSFSFPDPINSRYLAYSDENKEAVRKALGLISEYANIKFNELQAGRSDIQYYLGITTEGSNGAANYGAEVSLHRSLVSGGKTLANAEGTHVTLHETLHSLGAKHPFEPKHLPDRILSAQENRISNTIMSYAKDIEYPKDLRIFDLAFLHYRFGVNPETRAENNIYRFRPFNQKSADGDIYIWDGGGIDTFDASDQTQAVHIDLTPGSWIWAGTKTDKLTIDQVENLDKYQYFNLDRKLSIENSEFFDIYHYNKQQAFIGYGTQIERLMGSDYNDELSGNNADNAIYGGKGNDHIIGGLGNDYLNGGEGNDTLIGGEGNDIFVVDNPNDNIVEKSDEGIDTVQSTINYQLGENIENLYLLEQAENGIGNALNNTLIGNHQNNHLQGGAGNDRLDGKYGDNILTGGEGQDIFIFSTTLNNQVTQITDFKVGEDKIELSNAIFTAIDNQQDIQNHIFYDKTSGQLLYQDDNNNVFHFADLPTNLTLTENSFILV